MLSTATVLMECALRVHPMHVHWAPPGYRENANGKVANEIAKCKVKLSVYDFALFPYDARLSLEVNYCIPTNEPMRKTNFVIPTMKKSVKPLCANLKIFFTRL